MEVDRGDHLRDADRARSPAPTSPCQPGENSPKLRYIRAVSFPLTLTLGGDMTVRRPGFGALHTTGPGGWGDPADREGTKTLLRRAVALGVNFIDTADSYGPYTSERLIAEALYPYPDELVIATKGGLVRDGPSTDLWPENGLPEHLKAACEGSLKRLRLDRIDLYQLHKPDPNVPLEESLGALAELQAEGKIRHIGVSNVSVEELERAQTVVRVVSVQNRYNLVDRTSEDVLEACSAQQLAFIAWHPLEVGSPGQLSGALARVASRLGTRASQITLAWLLQRSPVMLPIPGTSSIEHLEENVAAAMHRLMDAELATLNALATRPEPSTGHLRS
jgi:pyridoxine 4-dehydrogenase